MSRNRRQKNQKSEAILISCNTHNIYIKELLGEQEKKYNDMMTEIKQSIAVKGKGRNREIQEGKLCS